MFLAWQTPAERTRRDEREQNSVRAQRIGTTGVVEPVRTYNLTLRKLLGQSREGVCVSFAKSTGPVRGRFLLRESHRLPPTPTPYINRLGPLAFLSRSNQIHETRTKPGSDPARDTTPPFQIQIHPFPLCVWCEAHRSHPIRSISRRVYQRDHDTPAAGAGRERERDGRVLLDLLVVVVLGAVRRGGVRRQRLGLRLAQELPPDQPRRPDPPQARTSRPPPPPHHPTVVRASSSIFFFSPCVRACVYRSSPVFL